jgi:hypothetical protein
VEFVGLEASGVAAIAGDPGLSHLRVPNSESIAAMTDELVDDHERAHHRDKRQGSERRDS